MTRELVEIAARGAEIAGVVIILGGLVFAAARYAFVSAPSSSAWKSSSRLTSSARWRSRRRGRWPWQRGAART